MQFNGQKLAGWKFIVLEGIDGSGKSTLAAALAGRCKDAALFCEPTANSPFKDEIRGILGSFKTMDDTTNDQLSRLFLQDRLWNIQNNLKPKIAQGNKIILDRYFFSTAAYQAKNSDQSLEIAETYLQNPDILYPDAVIWVDLDENEALKRLKARSKSLNKNEEVFEKLNQLRRIRQNYIKLFTNTQYAFPVFRLDASVSAEELADRAAKILQIDN